jgi:hypothetical protein
LDISLPSRSYEVPSLVIICLKDHSYLKCTRNRCKMSKMSMFLPLKLW